MGHSTTAISFFDTQLAIRPHSATQAKYLDKRVTMQRFANGEPISLYKRDDNGEFIAMRGRAREFIEGPIVK